MAIISVAMGCDPVKKDQAKEDNKEFAAFLQKYYDERMQLYPIEATANGDNRFNDLLPADFTDSYRSKLKEFFEDYKSALAKMDAEQMNDNDKASYDIFKYEMETTLEGLTHHYMGGSAIADNSYIPFDQFNGLPLLMGQMGGGTGNQPFKTVQDYDNWLKRATAFSAWTDSAIVYFKKGMAANYVLPKALVVKMIPQMQAMVTDSATKSLFYEPIKLMPASFSEADKSRLTAAYIDLIQQHIVPSYKHLA